MDSTNYPAAGETPFPWRRKSGHYVRVFAGDSVACADNAEGTMECWGGIERLRDESPVFDAALDTSPLQVFFQRSFWTAPAVGQTTPLEHFYVMMLKTGGRLAAYESGTDGVPVVNEDRICSREPATFRQVSGLVDCMGIDVQGRLHALNPWDINDPLFAGRYRSLSGGSDYGCAIREDSELVCWTPWDTNEPWQDLWPHEQARSVSVGARNACIVRDSGLPYCWHDQTLGDYKVPPQEPLSELCVGSQAACGITEKDGAIRCWGRDDEFTVPPPELDDE